MSRRHEIWDIVGHADMLERGWGKPGTRRGRHWDSLIAIRALVRSENILDIACGQGHFYAVLSETVDYLGIDNSEDMLEKARQAFPNNKECFIQGDAYNLDYNIRHYDTVVMVDLLMHLPEIETPIKQAWGKTAKELLIAHQIAREHVISESGSSGGVVLPDFKRLLNRYDTISGMYEVFAKLTNVGSIEQFFYDERLQIFRLTRGIPNFGSFRNGWLLGGEKYARRTL